MKNSILLTTLLFLGIYACTFTEPRKLNKASKTEINKIIKELKLEHFEYEYTDKNENFKKSKIFTVTLYNIEDSIDFHPYNKRIIDAFNKSGYNFKNEVTYINIFYIKNILTADLLVLYRINPKNMEIFYESND